MSEIINPMSVAAMFDLAAPIAIMHFADVTFEDKAIECVVELYSNSLVRRNVREVFQKRPTLALALSAWREYIEHPETDDLDHINTVYKDLFTQIIIDLHPDWQLSCDQYGALGFRDEDGYAVFFGDSYNNLPWYETADLLGKRVYQYEKDSEKAERE